MYVAVVRLGMNYVYSLYTDIIHLVSTMLLCIAILAS